LLLFSQAAEANAGDDKSSLVKAAFIYNFVKFVEWPAPKKVSTLSQIDICALGDSGISKAGNVFQAASTDKLKLNLVSEKDWKSAPDHCHILFIGQSEVAQVQQIVAGLKTFPVLTVSDSDDFVEHGGMIGFVVSDNKIRIAVNTKAVSSAGLRVDAQLLEIALKVIDR
jgi:hypothetical protein